MRAFEPYTKYEFSHPEDMEKILNYLNERGKLNIRDNIVEKYYMYFSDDRYDAGWMSVTEQTLEEFAEYLHDLEI